VPAVGFADEEDGTGELGEGHVGHGVGDGVRDFASAAGNFHKILVNLFCPAAAIRSERQEETRPSLIQNRRSNSVKREKWRAAGDEGESSDHVFGDVDN
jgi:hypothetical protein